jgi:hypothetical protein
LAGGIETSTGLTVNVVEPLIELNVAVIVVLPKPVLVARPLLPAVLLIERRGAYSRRL